jgi:hypothetical protein
VYAFIVSLVLGATLYGFFVAALTAVLAEGDAAGQEYRRKLDKLQQYMRHVKMHAALRARIRAYCARRRCTPGIPRPASRGVARRVVSRFPRC